MKAEDFAKLYEAYRPKALNVIYRTGFKSASLAEDAVQNAALYFLKRLHSYERITEALFCHMAVKRMKDLLDGERGARRGNAPNREVGVGTPIDLADLEDPHRWTAPGEE